jgi:hypothetical protein
MAWEKDKAVSIAVRGALQDAIEDVPLLYMAQRGSPKPFAILLRTFPQTSRKPCRNGRAERTSRKPLGKTCIKKRRMNSSVLRVMIT